MSVFFDSLELKFRIVSEDSDIEKLLIYRNEDHVRASMFYDKLICRADHMRWYQNLDKSNNFYYIYSRCDEDVGVVNIKDVDRVKGKAEVGIFVSNQKYLGSYLNIAALLYVYGIAFNELALSELWATILPSNVRAIRMNRSLGFIPHESADNKFVLSKRTYQTKTIKYMEKIGKSIKI